MSPPVHGPRWAYIFFVTSKANGDTRNSFNRTSACSALSNSNRLIWSLVVLLDLGELGNTSWRISKHLFFGYNRNVMVQISIEAFHESGKACYHRLVESARLNSCTLSESSVETTKGGCLFRGTVEEVNILVATLSIGLSQNKDIIPPLIFLDIIGDAPLCSQYVIRPDR